MYDDVTLSLLPPGADAYAGYVNGTFANFEALKAKFPKAHLLDIAVSANVNATCLDVETGDATIGQIFNWFKAQKARGVFRPVIYTSAGNLHQLYLTMTANGFARSTYRVWSAHYGSGQHVCGATTCGFSLNGGSADGTQWTDVALGRSLDESVLADNFFQAAPPPPPPPPPAGKATQPTHVSGSARYTNATITWSGAKNVTKGYWVNLFDDKTGDHLVQDMPVPSNADSGSYTFHHLKMGRQYSMGVYARPGAPGSHSQWVKVTTKP